MLSDFKTPQQVLSVEQLNNLNIRSNWQGIAQLIAHLSVIGISGYLWATTKNNWWVTTPSLIIYGFSLAAMFAVVHECVHRSAFANNRLNDLVAWWAGVLSLYNSTFYRRYHKWHHRYTRIPGKDPELDDPQPDCFMQYLIEISGLTWWWGKIKGHLTIALGKVEHYPFISETARKEVINSTRLQLAVYLVAIAMSFIIGQPWLFIMYWLLPLAVGQIILRFILIAEHTGCSQDNNYFTNTRTTLTIFPIRLLMWNMPFHAEHHLYPSIPFYKLPEAHQQLSSNFTHLDSGYLQVNREIIKALTVK